MKKFLYHYFNLIITLLLVFFNFCGVYAFFAGYTVETGLIMVLIVTWIAPVVLVTLFIDSPLRKYREWYMILTAILVSPIRFIFQIITIVNFHKSGCSEEFSVRGGFVTYTFRSWFLYVLFGYDNHAETIQFRDYLKNGQESYVDIIYKEMDATGLTFSEVISKRRDPKRFARIKYLTGGLTAPTVKLCPFINFREGWESFYYFHLGDNHHRTATITSVKVDGTQMIFKEPDEDNRKVGSLFGLVLEPGKYTVRVGYRIEIPETDLSASATIRGFENTVISGSATTEITVTNPKKAIYLGLFVDIGLSYDLYSLGDRRYARGISWTKNAVLRPTSVDYFCRTLGLAVSDNWTCEVLDY